ncbi:cytochrome P450 [Agrocybe pediades]|nr:cytochrome P450 [Agrocybe pediades]
MMYSTALKCASSERLLQYVPSAVGLFIILMLLEKHLSPRRLSTLPMPGSASWIWGHEKQVFDDTVGKAYSNWMQQLQSHVFKIKAALFKPDIVVVTDPFALTHIMQKNIYDYPHSDVLRSRIYVLSPLGKSLGWVEGENAHREMRNLVASSLSQEAVRQGSSDIFSVAENLCTSLENHIAQQGCESTIINVNEWTSAVALDVIGRFGFGHDFQGGHSTDAVRILNAWRSMVKMGISLQGFVVLMFLRCFHFLNHLPLEALRSQGNVRLTIHQGIAEELVRRGKSHKHDGHDLLSKLMSAYQSQAISLEELKDHITMFIMSGSETTAQTMSHALWELARNPAVQAKLRKEIMSFHLGLSYDDMQRRTPYLDAVCREVLRLYPAGPYMERVSIKEDRLPLRFPITMRDGTKINEVHIRPGQTVIIPIYSIGRDNVVWGDGDVFRPERWMEESSNKEMLPTGWSNLLTFSDGPRQCVGRRLAVLEFKIVISSLIRRFEFVDTGDVITHKVASSLQPVCAGGGESNPKLPVLVKIL